MNDVGEISKHVGYDVLVCNNDEILPFKEMPNTDMQRTVIFDDFVCEKNQNH